jgi:RNA polymerase sigma-70 factor (ECF subfamily)
VVSTVTTSADSRLFEDLFDRHAAELLRYCFRRTADAALAEDLVSVVFLEAWRRRGDLRRDRDARPWLYGIATNVVRHQWRTRRRHDAAVRRLAAALPRDAQVDDPDERLAREQEMRAVLSAAAALPRRELDVLALCVWSELSYEEAAAALGVAVGTVRSRLSRGRARLRTTTLSEGARHEHLPTA